MNKRKINICCCYFNHNQHFICWMKKTLKPGGQQDPINPTDTTTNQTDDATTANMTGGDFQQLEDN